MRSAVAIYFGKNNGVFPPDRASVQALVTAGPGRGSAARRPTYDTANGKVTFTATVDDCP